VSLARGPMRRRDFLRLAAGLATAVALTSGARRALPTRVIVVGGGMAGIAAARQLRADGADVTVLEARSRIGGRIRTSRMWPDLPVDLGASWIHGAADNPLSALAREAGLRTHLTSYDRYRLYVSARARAAGVTGYGTRRVDAVLGDARRIAHESSADLSLADAVDLARPGIAPRSPLGIQLGFDLMSNHTLEYGADPDRLSARYGEAAGYPSDGVDSLLPDGYDQLVGALARGLSIRTGVRVASVRQDGDTAVVTDAAGVEHRADAVVVTVPLSLLKRGSIRFEPALPAAMQDAIDRIGFGLLDKQFLRFDRPFWPTDVDWLEYLDTDAADWPQWVSLATDRRAPLLLAFTGGSTAQRVEERPDRAVVDDMVRALRGMFGRSVPTPTGWQITRWGRSELTRGGYSFNAAGMVPDDRRVLAEPFGRIHIAGEATHVEHYGTVHGAYLSGVAAARRIWEGLSS
jgi:monoamine oxidase